jgi:hypothetical protein
MLFEDEQETFAEYTPVKTNELLSLSAHTQIENL